MLKKLVKYGNSNALVLDRAILELLNIGEGSIVKLRTDGKSLVITPHEAVKISELTMSGSEVIAYATEDLVKKQWKAIEADQEKKQQATQWMPGTENHSKLLEAFKNIMEKYKDDMLKLSSKEFNQDVDLLAGKYNGDKSSQGFIQEFLALRIKHVPNLANMDKEMQEVKKILGMPDYL